jgi:hypothetical protein
MTRYKTLCSHDTYCLLDFTCCIPPVPPNIWRMTQKTHKHTHLDEEDDEGQEPHHILHVGRVMPKELHQNNLAPHKPASATNYR